MDCHIGLCPGCHCQEKLKIEASLYTILQVLSVSLFEKIPIYQALTLSDYKEPEVATSNQLKLFE
jgi:hypothetical protein